MKGADRKEQSGVICFPCVLERTPYLLSTTLILSVSVFVSVLTSGNGRNGSRSE
jgi:hypothetical protein